MNQSLHYYPGDYKPISSASDASLLTSLGSAASPLYNGNIAAMAVNIPVLGNPLVYNYRYDQLDRITKMDAYTGLNDTTGTFVPVQIGDYKERFSYDPDGSIQSLLRHGHNKTIDSASWDYYANTHRLEHINDPAGRYGFDAGAQSANNYSP